MRSKEKHTMGRKKVKNEEEGKKPITDFDNRGKTVQ